jgi:chromate reductase, NAD(P)H dehydrogenase (quinone)
MVDLRPLRVVMPVGSLRKGSCKATIACGLPSLAPEGATVEPLGSIGAFPHHDAELKADGFRA